jgi:predicted nucleic acid-binding protein
MLPCLRTNSSWPLDSGRAELRKITPLKLPDAIHLATAIAAQCAFFLSRDRDFKRLPEWMELDLPTAEGFSRVLRAAG